MTAIAVAITAIAVAIAAVSLMLCVLFVFNAVCSVGCGHVTARLSSSFVRENRRKFASSGRVDDFRTDRRAGTGPTSTGKASGRRLSDRESTATDRFHVYVALILRRCRTTAARHRIHLHMHEMFRAHLHALTFAARSPAADATDASAYSSTGRVRSLSSLLLSSSLLGIY